MAQIGARFVFPIYIFILRNQIDVCWLCRTKKIDRINIGNVHSCKPRMCCNFDLMLQQQLHFFRFSFCSYGLIMFRQNDLLVRATRRSCFSFKYPFMSPRTWLEMLRGFIKDGWNYAWKYPIVSNLHMLKHSPELGSLARQPSLLCLHHHSLHLTIWKSGHNHVMWTWYDTFCRNVKVST